MFNICDFSNINTVYGNDIGDEVLISTATRLRKEFSGHDVYRTGSDEFVVSIKMTNDQNDYDKVMNLANTAMLTLSKPIEISSNHITIKFKMAVVKKSGEINTSVISSLKNITNHSEPITFEKVNFVDLDT